jgi:transposase-like protein
MVARISSEIRGAIKVHVQNGLSPRKILTCLSELGMTVSNSTIINVMKEIAADRAGIVREQRK